MTENYFIGIYWGARKEKIENCIDKVNETFIFLKEIDESFAFWYKTDKPLKGEVIEPLDINKASIEKLLIAGQNYNDDNTLNEDLGYHLYLKSSKNYSRAHILSFTCGGYSDVSESIPNSVNISIKATSIINKLFDKAKVEFIYKKLNDIWKPERGVMQIDE